LANGDDPVRPGLGPAEPPAREYFRAALAIILALAFLAEIVGAIVFLSISPFELDDTIGALKELATIFISPTVALVGAAAGFYFGKLS